MTRELRTRTHPVYALVVFGVVALLVNLVRSASDFTAAKPDRSSLPRGGLMYQVLCGEECVGTVFAEFPLSLGEVLRRVGIAHEGDSGPDHVIPGGTEIRLARESSGFVLGKIPGSQLVTVGLRIDLNRADEADLVALPGIGPALARRIVRERERRGKFIEVTELRQISGIGPKKLSGLLRWLYVSKTEGPEPGK
jgi:hypothetical protein